MDLGARKTIKSIPETYDLSTDLRGHVEKVSTDHGRTRTGDLRLIPIALSNAKQRQSSISSEAQSSKRQFRPTARRALLNASERANMGRSTVPEDACELLSAKY